MPDSRHPECFGACQARRFRFGKAAQIGGFDEPKVKALLDIPKPVKVVAMTPLGYPWSPELTRPAGPNRRKSEGEVFSRDRYGNPLVGSQV